MNLHIVTVRHNFETAHRLPFLGGRCTNLHGHSWTAEIAIGSNELDEGVLVEFGVLKRAFRTWVDTFLDHGAALGADDPLVPALAAEDCKVLLFGNDELVDDLHWPTVENMAVLMGRVAAYALGQCAWSGVRPTVVWTRVQETAVNAAEWHA